MSLRDVIRYVTGTEVTIHVRRPFNYKCND